MPTIEKDIVILGTGMAGLSCSFHLKDKNVFAVDKNSYLGGHAASHNENNYYWDEGPHVCFSKHQYVRNLFTKNVPHIKKTANLSNFFNGHWIKHPAQANLKDLPEPLRTKCYEEMKNIAENKHESVTTDNYEDWLKKSLGGTFYKNFSAPYTRKYWTIDPQYLSSDWVGKRVSVPNLDELKAGYLSTGNKQENYITEILYPKEGGFSSFLTNLTKDIKVQLSTEVKEINLKNKTIALSDKTIINYNKLINTIPLDKFISLIKDVPSHILDANNKLYCSSLMLINVIGKTKKRSKFDWFYVYDEDLMSTRVTNIQELSMNNNQSEDIAFQVEVYQKKYEDLQSQKSKLQKIIPDELIKMGIIESSHKTTSNFIKYANVVFDHNRENSLNKIFNWLQNYGLEREQDDLDPSSNWDDKTKQKLGNVILAGRFAQWKYFWTDDCVLRGKYISENI